MYIPGYSCRGQYDFTYRSLKYVGLDFFAVLLGAAGPVPGFRVLGFSRAAHINPKFYTQAKPKDPLT